MSNIFGKLGVNHCVNVNFAHSLAHVLVVPVRPLVLSRGTAKWRAEVVWRAYWSHYLMTVRLSNIRPAPSCSLSTSKQFFDDGNIKVWLIHKHEHHRKQSRNLISAVILSLYDIDVWWWWSLVRTKCYSRKAKNVLTKYCDFGKKEQKGRQNNFVMIG